MSNNYKIIVIGIPPKNESDTDMEPVKKYN